MPDLHRKTALKDDAGIYKTDRERTERQKWGEMDKEQRRQYLADYYLGRLLCILAALAAAALLLWHFLRPANETVLYVAVVDESLDAQKLERMTAELNDRFGVDGKHKKVLIDDTFFMKDDGLTRIEVYLHSRQLDVIIADKDVWKELAGYGFLKRMDSLTEDLEGSDGRNGSGVLDHEDDFLETEGYLDSEVISFEDREVAKGEAAFYGVDLTGSGRFGEMKEYMEHPVFAIAEGTRNEKYAEDFLDYLME